MQTAMLLAACECDSYGEERDDEVVCANCGVPYVEEDMDRVDAAIEKASIVIKAAESWHSEYRKNRAIFTDLLKVEARMETVLRRYYREFAERAVGYIDWYTYQTTMQSIQAADKFNINVIVSDGPFGQEDGLFINVVYKPISDAATLGGLAGEKTYNLDIGTSSTSDYIQRISKDRVAYLVGKRVDKDGVIVDNPNSKYRVTDTVRDSIKRSISTSMSLGETVEQATARIKRTIADPKRAAMIARTEAIYAYQHGLLEMGLETGAVGKEWKTVNYEDICGTNAAQGVIAIKKSFASGDQAPPGHPNCVVGSTTVHSTANAAVTKRFYKGWIVKITTAAGNKLSITPNHPVLTSHGWVAAGELQKGDNVISCLDAQGISSVINPNNNYAPTRIKKIFESFRRSSSVTTSASVPVTSVDFHGDASDGNVDVIWSSSFLDGGGYATITKPFMKKQFIGSDTQLLLFSGYSSLKLFLKRMLPAPYGFVRSLNIPNILSFGAPLHHEPIGFSTRSLSDPVFCEDSDYDASRDTELHSKLIDRFSGNVSLDNIVSVKRLPFFGHVYNLETDSGWYISNNIVTHNCRCSLRLVYPEDPSSKVLDQPTNPGQDLSTAYHGQGHNLANGNYMFGDTYYVTRSKDTAAEFGKVKEVSLGISAKDILFIESNQAYRDLVQKALLKYIGENLNTALPKYVLSLGYKAVEMSPTVDPLGGIAIVDPSFTP